MVELNLLPWRDGLHRKKTRRWLLLFILIGLMGVGVSFMLLHRMKQQWKLESSRNETLQQELVRLRLKNQALSHSPASKAIQLESKKRLKPALVSKTFAIHYANARELALTLKDKSNALLSRKGKVAFDSRTNVLWVEDKEAHIKKIMLFLKHLDVQVPQILIEARLVTINKESAQDLGVRLGFLQAHEDGQALKVGLNLAATPMASAPATLGITAALINKQGLLDMELTALESIGRAKVIASPRLMTTNQDAALIEAGEDIPYQEFAAINGQTSVAFKKAVLRLRVVPQITMKGELMMALSINQDADSGKRVQGVPIISTKAIETHVLVGDGQTIVLGGIYQQDNNHQYEQVPVLSHLPLLGKLFKRQQTRSRDEELLIFITPKILVNKI